MMGSVRDRIEREREQRSRQSPEPPAPMRRGSPLSVATHQPSTRERADAREFEVTPERLTPIDKHRAEQMTSVHSPTVTSVRSRLDQQRAAEEAKSEQPTRTAAAEFYLAEYDREQAE